jgi:hypothetical protein
MDTTGSNCEEVRAEKNYPLTQVPLQCPVPTPSINSNYKYRDPIEEDVIVVTGTFEPVNSQTPTPTNTPTNTPTPPVTPTQTVTPYASPTATQTVTPTATPPPTPSNTHAPRFVFILEVSISLDTEAVLYFDMISKSLLLYHAVEGAFPQNPIFLQWSVTKDGVIIDQGKDFWTIPWRLTTAPVPRLSLLNYKEDAAKYATQAAAFAGAATAAYMAVWLGAAGFASNSTGVILSVTLFNPLTIGVALVVGLVIFALFKLFGNKKPPPPKPYPQYSAEYKLPAGLIIPLTNFKLNPGSTPSHVYDGGVTVEVLPTPKSRFIAAINIADLTALRRTTTDSYKFQLSTSNY